MKTSDYDRVAKAIVYIVERTAAQPSLEEIAAHVHMSPFHFQRLFRRWAGTTPKRFLQVLTLERGKHLLGQSLSLLEVAGTIGLSSGSRLHDHFVHLEAVTPGEYKTKGKGLNIEYGTHETPFGTIFIAMTPRGICRADFLGSGEMGEQLTDLEKSWPQASFTVNTDKTARVIARMLGADAETGQPLPLQVSGTNFQLSVWRALLRIPTGEVASYSQIAALLGCPQSSRAVGNAIGANPVAFLIPCHRVIQQSGALGGYRWGATRKQAMQTWERLRR